MNDATLRSRCLHGLQKVSARCGILPKSYWTPHDSLVRADGAPSAIGRVSNVCHQSIDGQSVAVKTISSDCIGNFNSFRRVRLVASPHRIFLMNSGFLQKLCSNAVMWKRLKHPNVVPFLGLGSNAPPFSLVYPWMPGSLSEYVRENPDVDRLGMVCSYS